MWQFLSVNIYGAPTIRQAQCKVLEMKRQDTVSAQQGSQSSECCRHGIHDNPGMKAAMGRCILKRQKWFRRGRECLGGGGRWGRAARRAFQAEGEILGRKAVYVFQQTFLSFYNMPGTAVGAEDTKTLKS